MVIDISRVREKRQQWAKQFRKTVPAPPRLWPAVCSLPVRETFRKR